jgi:hypothetical protein
MNKILGYGFMLSAFLIIAVAMFYSFGSIKENAIPNSTIYNMTSSAEGLVGTAQPFLFTLVIIVFIIILLFFVFSLINKLNGGSY